MIQLDLSKALHPRVLELAPPLVPGAFFVVCVLLANPQLIHSQVQSLGIGHVIETSIAVLVSYVIGSAGMMLVRVIQVQLMWVARAERFSTSFLARQLVGPLGRALPKVKPYYQRALARVHRQLLDLSFGRGDELTWNDAYRVWYRSAKRLLVSKYGMEPPRTGEWRAWYHVLAPIALRGNVAIVALHACGWCALAATCFAPVLMNKQFIAFCFLLVCFGLLHDWELARNLISPQMIALFKTTKILEEIDPPKSPEATSATREATEAE